MGREGGRSGQDDDDEDEDEEAEEEEGEAVCTRKCITWEDLLGVWCDMAGVWLGQGKEARSRRDEKSDEWARVTNGRGGSG